MAVLEGWPPITLALLGGIFTWSLTLIGTIPVLFFLRMHRKLLDLMMGFAGGVMVAASCWSLLIPSLESGGLARALIGLGAGAGVFFLFDRTVPHVHSVVPDEATPEGPKVAWRRSMLVMAAITMHNVPEGLAVGLGFGSGNLGPAIALTIGIGMQNVPEGLAIAMPLRRDGMGRWKALWYGQLSAAVEPFAAVLGALFVQIATGLLPYGLAFAAGAMLYVVVEELIPETTRSGNIDVATMGFVAGFAIMMALDQIAG